jgi:hypothetical protein
MELRSRSRISNPPIDGKVWDSILLLLFFFSFFYWFMLLRIFIPVVTEKVWEKVGKVLD